MPVLFESLMTGFIVYRGLSLMVTLLAAHADMKVTDRLR